MSAADEPPAAPSLRERGNSAFKNRDFETAEALYSAAIDETSSDADGDAASLLSNRAAARRARYAWSRSVLNGARAFCLLVVMPAPARPGCSRP